MWRAVTCSKVQDGNFFVVSKIEHKTAIGKNSLKSLDFIERSIPVDLSIEKSAQIDLLFKKNLFKTIEICIIHLPGSRKGYGNPKRISFLSGFSFPLRLEPCGPSQSNVMGICARQE